LAVEEDNCKPSRLAASLEVLKILLTETVRGVKEVGVDDVWPGCDLAPQTPLPNIKSFIAS